MRDVHRVLSLAGAVVSLTGGVVGHRVEVCGVVSRGVEEENCTVTLILNDGAVRRGMRGAKLGASSAIDERANPGRRGMKEDVSSLEKAVRWFGGSRARGVGYVSGSPRKLFKTSREKSFELST